MGNLKAESNIKSVIYEAIYKPKIGLSDEDYVKGTNNGTYTDFINDKVGFGLAQWTYSTRKEALLKTCKGDIGNLQCQLKYLIYELKHDYSEVLSILKSSKNVKQCSDKVLIDFEKPKNTSESEKNRRYNFAQNFYDKFSHTLEDSSSNSIPRQ